MRKKELIKAAREIPDDVIRQQVEHNGLSVKDYFLWKSPESYLVCYWQNGVQYANMDDDDVNSFAVAQYLLARGVIVYGFNDVIPTPQPPAS